MTKILPQNKKGRRVNSVMQSYLKHFYLPSLALPSDLVAERILLPTWAAGPALGTARGWAGLVAIGCFQFNLGNVLLRGAENAFTSYFKITRCPESFFFFFPVMSHLSRTPVVFCCLVAFFAFQFFFLFNFLGGGMGGVLLQSAVFSLFLLISLLFSNL